MEWGIAMTAATLLGMLGLVVAAVQMDEGYSCFQSESGPDLEPKAAIGSGSDWRPSEEFKQAA
jgi:hypothetical protein